MLDKSCACCDSCCEFICADVTLCPEDTVALESSIISGSYGLSVPFSAVISEPLEEGCSIYVPYRAEHSIISDLLHLGQLCIFVLIGFL